ncbi:purine-nucleoside phosphorylase [Desulfopila aestuarii]|uniref:Purine nucleoside phosphorylase n=1 Tax=Desulfopila aestuarii DSM 18488 TaxID=1121416 RepID=A0A1M7YIN8_9BACT|nr:purine-nucleoside phosphorylase [Desulfopila aestuarii]SHO52378.1 purine-nucleoside phosphorylase [Desulfopila aestuarii DSM 18488]
MKVDLNRIIEAAEYIQSAISGIPKFCVVLGSGLGGFADNLEERVEIPFSEIPHFPESTVEGHKGRLVVGMIDNIYIMAMQGRFHYYEGYSMAEVAFPIRCLLYLKVENLIVTNAAGSVDPAITPGDIMVIRDHIKLHGDSPLRGVNIDSFGPRFNDMSDPYPKRVRELTCECGKELGIELKEGVYFYMPGPSYETAGEIKAINILGANAVGMSTVPEVIVAVHGGMQVLGLSCITNMGTGMRNQVVDHQEVIVRGEASAAKLMALLRLVITRWPTL